MPLLSTGMITNSREIVCNRDFNHYGAKAMSLFIAQSLKQAGTALESKFRHVSGIL